MRKYLLPETGHYYKANLHCHSTVSDGTRTPEQLKKAYMDHGYSVLAYTDHDVMIDHSDLADEHFLPLNGYEMEVNEAHEHGNRTWKTCHMCLIALEPDNLKQVCWHRSKYLFANAKNYRDQVQFDDTLPDYEREYTPERINDMMMTGRNSGFFVSYNHPVWSLETRDEYLKFDGMHALEIYNFGSVDCGFDDYVPMVYDEMLRAGKRISCTASDDNHNLGENWEHDSFGGFSMIKAERLEYQTITRALVNGDYYASMGPEIYDLYVEDGRVFITCSPAKRITMNTGVRNAKCAWATAGEPLTATSFELNPEDVYIRLTVIDEEGKCANTRAYFFDEM